MVLRNKNNEKYRIVSRLPNNRCVVEFEEPHYIGSYLYFNAAKGAVKNPLSKYVHGIGCIGNGSFTSSEGGKKTKAYYTWINMLKRVYKPRNNFYLEVEVCEEWHNFQNFAEWYYNKLPPKDWQLDKDILSKEGKVYSPENCCFVPQEINKLFTLRHNDRGQYPVGVSLDKRSGKFIATISRANIRKELGRFSSSEEAFLVYKREKEIYIKELAEKWKPYLDERVYVALLNYEININQ